MSYFLVILHIGSIFYSNKKFISSSSLIKLLKEACLKLIWFLKRCFGNQLREPKTFSCANDWI